MTIPKLQEAIFEFVRDAEYRTPQTYGALAKMDAEQLRHLAGTFYHLSTVALVISNQLTKQANKGAN